MKIKTPMEVRLCKSLESIENYCNSLLISEDRSYITLSGALLFNYLLELTRIYYIKDRNPDYTEEICLYKERDSIIVSNSGTMEIKSWKNSNAPNFGITFQYVLYKLNLPMVNEALSIHIVRTRNKCAHSILEIYNAITLSIDMLLYIRTLLIDIYTQMCKESGYTPTNPDFLITTFKYINDMSTPDKCPLLHMLGTNSETSYELLYKDKIDHQILKYKNYTIKDINYISDNENSVSTSPTNIQPEPTKSHAFTNQSNSEPTFLSPSVFGTKQ